MFGTKVKQIKILQGDIDEKERALDRTRSQAMAKEVQAEATRKSKKSIYEQALSAYNDIEDEIRKCITVCPARRAGGLLRAGSDAAAARARSSPSSPRASR